MLCGFLILSVLQSVEISSNTSSSLKKVEIEIFQKSTQEIDYNSEYTLNFGTKISIIFVISDKDVTQHDIFDVLSSLIIQYSTEIWFEWLNLLGDKSAGQLCIMLIGTIKLDRERFYRDSKKEIPQNRIIIQKMIVNNPGISLRELQRMTGLGMGGIQYHIYYLESEIVESFNLGRCKHFFISFAEFSQQEKIWYSLKRNKNIRSIIESLQLAKDGCSQKELTQFTGNSKSLISYYVKNLKNLGIIEDHERVLKISDSFILEKQYEN